MEEKRTYKPMQINVLNIEKCIKKYAAKQVTSTVKTIFKNETMSFHPHGLFSEEIFGKIGTEERMNNLGYIDLGTKVIEPYLCIALEKSSQDFANTIAGKQRWKVNADTFIKSEDEDDLSGIEFIYKFFDKFMAFILKENGSANRRDILDITKKYDKEVLFTSKWLVIPAGLRDINTIDSKNVGKVDYDPVNDYYTSLITISNQLRALSTDALSSSMVSEKFAYRMQQDINNIYRYFIEGKIPKKGGLLQQRGLAKTISYSAGNVICIAKQTRNKYNEDDSTNIKFGHFGIPTVQLLDMYYPFILHRIKELFTYDEKIKEVIGYLVGAKDHHSSNDIIEKFINKSKNDRNFVFKKMKSKENEIAITIKHNNEHRVLNVLEFLKNEIVDPVIIDKFVTATRFPVDNKLSQQYLKPIATMTESVEVVQDINDIRYELCKNEVLILAWQPNNHTLKPQGGDLDGDALASIGVFSDEANKAIEEEGWLCKNPLTTTVKPITYNENEILFGLYTLTK